MLLRIRIPGFVLGCLGSVSNPRKLRLQEWLTATGVNR